MPEIQVTGREGWIKLHSTSDLPLSVPSGLSFRRFAKLRHDKIAAGLQDPIVPVVSTPPGGSTSDDIGGVQHGPGRTSTPGNYNWFIMNDEFDLGNIFSFGFLNFLFYLIVF